MEFDNIYLPYVVHTTYYLYYLKYMDNIYVHCTLYNVYYTLYTKHCTLKIVRYTVNAPEESSAIYNTLKDGITDIDLLEKNKP